MIDQPQGTQPKADDQQGTQPTGDDKPNPGTQPASFKELLEKHPEYKGELDAMMEQTKTREASKRAQLEKELEQLKGQNMTDQEKAIAEARKEVEDTYTKRLQAAELRGATNARLVARGFSPEVATDVLDLLSADSFDTPEELTTAALNKLEAWGMKPGATKQPTPDIGGAQPKGAGPKQWTDEEVDAAVKDGTYLEKRGEILAARGGADGVRTMDPGGKAFRPVI
jgi:hypothetical protein